MAGILIPPDKSRGVLPVSLPQRMKSFGMDPNADRLGLLPYPKGALSGQEIDWSNWVAPEWIYEAAKAAVLPGHVAQGGTWSPSDVTDMAGVVMGGSSIGSAPAGALRSGLGKGKSFLDDAERTSIEEAAQKRKRFFVDKQAARTDAMAKALDPSNKQVKGVHAPYTGEFGYGKVLPVSQINAYDVGLKVSPHPKADQSPRKALTLDDIEGRILTVAGGDKMRVGQVNEVKGQAISPVDALGGVDNASLGTVGNRSGWQSGGGKINPLAEIVSKNPTEEVLTGIFEMGPNASDFQRATVRVLSEISDPTSITKKNAKIIDKILRDKDKTDTYPGVKTDEFLPWLINQSNTVRSGLLKSLVKTGANVKDVMPKGKVPYELIPGFDIPAARHALTNPKTLYSVQHPTDPSMGPINYFEANAPTKKSSDIEVPHEAFELSIAGDRLGELPTDYEIPMSLFQPDYIMGRRGLGAIGNDAAPIAQVMINKGLPEPSQRLTPKILDRIDKYMKAWDDYDY